MAGVQGLTSRLNYVTPPGGANVPANAPATQPMVATGAEQVAIIDGTPVRVAIITLSAAVGLVALRMAGFRFNVGVSN